MYYGEKRKGFGFDWSAFADILGSGTSLASSIWGNNAVTSLPIYQAGQTAQQAALYKIPSADSGISTTTLLLLGGVAIIGILFLSKK